MPGPELAFHNPDTGQGDTYTVPDETVSAAWPLEVSVDIPMEWESGVDVTIPVTLTNIATSVTAEGIFTGTVEGVDGTVLWSQNYSLNIAPGEVQVVSMPVQITTSDGYALLYGEVALGTAHEHVFREIVAVEGERKVYLPLVLWNR